MNLSREQKKKREKTKTLINMALVSGHSAANSISSGSISFVSDQ